MFDGACWWVSLRPQWQATVGGEAVVRLAVSVVPNSIRTRATQRPLTIVPKQRYSNSHSFGGLLYICVAGDTARPLVPRRQDRQQ